MEGMYDGNFQVREVGRPSYANSLTLPGLVTQKTESIKSLDLRNKTGERIDVHADGCMMVSLYNALVINGYKQNFEEFTKNLVSNDCINQDGSIEWAAFNNLDTDYNFRWMQDSEIKKCDRVNINNLDDWVKTKNFALAKVQSVFLPWKRHFMVVLGVDKGNVECLEASAIGGKLKLRTIPENQILGVRYFKLKQGNPQPNQPGFKQISPFSKTEPASLLT